MKHWLLILVLVVACQSPTESEEKPPIVMLGDMEQPVIIHGGWHGGPR